MVVQFQKISKRFNRDWIFRDIDLASGENTRCAILGGNGSGKSTLLQIISGYMAPSSGQITWTQNGSSIPAEKIYSLVSLCTPYMGVYDDFTLRENVTFYMKFKTLRGNIGATTFAERIGLSPQLDKPLKFFSSGMRQRVKLGLALLSETPLLLLDEPTSHLDANAIHWFRELLVNSSDGRSIFIASNSHEDEIFHCTERLLVDDFR
jgi:ABC-type multidrug transport system ATPase subunit